MQGKVGGTRSRGTSLMHWTDQAKSATGNPVSDCAGQSTNRERWRKIHAPRAHRARTVRYTQRECYEDDDKKSMGCQRNNGYRNHLVR